MSDANSPSDEATARRRPIVAVLLSFVAPGLGLVYAGRLWAGLVINVLFVLVTLLFVIAATAFRFFPLYPAIVLVATWFVFCGLSGLRARELILDDRSRPPRPYQHPLIYALIALSTCLAPLAVTGHFTTRHLLTVVPVEAPEMYPQIRAGDHVLIDRTSYQNDPPRRGDLVAFRPPDTDEPVIRRVVGIPGDEIQMHGYTLAVDDALANYSPVDLDDVADHSLDELEAELWVEYLDDRRYVISVVPGSSVDTHLAGLQLRDDEFFVLSDNRSFVVDDSEQSTDSRSFGAVDAERIEGQPLYIAWSALPDGDSPAWERLGLPTH